MKNVSDIQYKNISPKAKGCMRLNAIIRSVILLAVVASVLAILTAVGVIPFGVFAGVSVALLVLLAADVIVVPSIRYKRYKYYIDDDMLIVVEGLWFINKSIAPIERIHQIAVNRGPIDRMYGMSNVEVTTAGGVVKIAFLENEVAEEIAQRLRIRINSLAKAEKLEESRRVSVLEGDGNE